MNFVEISFDRKTVFTISQKMNNSVNWSLNKRIVTTVVYFETI